MIERFKVWFRAWLGILTPNNQSELIQVVQDHSGEVGVLQSQMGSVLAAIAIMQTENRELRLEMTQVHLDMFTAGCRLEKIEGEIAKIQLAQYVPPRTEDPKPKVIQTRTMREFNAILEQEMENADAPR